MKVKLPQRSTREVWGVDDDDVPEMASKKDKDTWHQNNLKLVNDELYGVDARHLANLKGPNGGSLDIYARGGKTVIVQEYGDHSGLEIWVPLTVSMKMADVLNKLREYLKAE